MSTKTATRKCELSPALAGAVRAAYRLTAESLEAPREAEVARAAGVTLAHCRRLLAQLACRGFVRLKAGRVELTWASWGTSFAPDLTFDGMRLALALFGEAR